jgi:hypothetical protein
MATHENDTRIKRVLSCLVNLNLVQAEVRRLGPNGPEVHGLEGQWQEALKLLMLTKDADVIGVFVNSETGLPIDFHWGWTSEDQKSKGQGLAKLSRWHPEVVASLDRIVAEAVVVGSPSPDRFILSDGRHLLVISQRHNDIEKRWLVTAFHAGRKPSKKDRLLLIQAKRKMSQATSRTVDGASIAGQTNASIAGTNSTDRLVPSILAETEQKINESFE